MGGFLLKELQAFTFLTSSACPLEWQFPYNHISQQHQKLHDMKTRCKPSAKHVVISSDWLGKGALHGIPQLKFFPTLTHIIYIWMHWLISYDQAIPLKHIQIKSSGVCILQPRQRCRFFFNWMWLKSKQYLAPLLCFKFTVNYLYWKYSPIPLILK